MTKIGGQGTVAALDVGGQEEPLAVFVNREADRTAELILLINVGGIAEGIVLGQTAAAKVFVRFAVEVVRSRFGNHVEQAAGGAAEFGSESVGDNLEFLDGFNWDGEVLGFERAKVLAEKVVGGVGTVDDEPVVIALLAAEPNGTAESGNNLRGRSQLREVAIIAAGERQIVQALGIEELRDARGSGVDGAGGFRGNGNALFGGLELHMCVQGDRGADGDVDFLNRVVGEIAGLENERVLAWGEGFEVLAAFRVGGELAFEAGRRIRQDHFDAGNRRAGGVVDKTMDGAAIESLRGNAKRSEQQNQQREIMQGHWGPLSS